MSEASTSDPCNLRKWPDDWKQISLRWLSKRYTGGTPNTGNPEYWSDGSIPWLNSGAVNQGTITEPSAYITEVGLRESSAKWIPTGSVVMALAGQGKTKATVGYVAIPTTGNQSLAAIVPEKIDGRFLFWWLSSRYRWLRHQSSQDGRDGINLEMIGSISCPLPPLDTQKRIARYLDEKTARIDALIGKKRELLERLAEKRQALITHAVTKGLNPNAPMKPSGIDWLGEIPAHWEVKKLKQLVSIWGRIGFRGYTVADIVDEGEGALAISPSNIVDGMFNRLVRTYVSWDKYYESPEIVVKAGDLLFVKTGSTIGKVCRVSSLNEAMTINPQVVILRPSGCVSIFLKLAIQSSYFQHQVSGRIMGGSTPALNQQNLGSLLLTIPPLCEQEKIADDILSELERCFSAEKKITESISTMDQYRAALITAAVTGQIAELN